ncbi:MAG: GAF domain-containing protein [Chloroflexota bacterium]
MPNQESTDKHTNLFLLQGEILQATSCTGAAQMITAFLGAHGFGKVLILESDQIPDRYSVLSHFGYDVEPQQLLNVQLGDLDLSYATSFVYDTRGDKDAIPSGLLPLVSKDMSRMVVIPLRTNHEVLGVAILESQELNQRLSTSIERALHVVPPLSLMIRNARQLAAERIERERAATLREVVSLLNASLDLDEVLQSLLRVSADALDADNCSILLWDTDTQQLVFRASTDLPRQKLDNGLVVPLHSSIAGRAFRSREPQMVINVAKDADYFGRIANEAGTELHSLLAVPIVREDKVLGVVEAIYGKRREFKNTEVQLLSAIANSAATALFNAKLYADSQVVLDKRTLELETIRRTAAVVNRAPTEDEIVTQGLREMVQASPAAAGAIFLLNRYDQEGDYCLAATRNISSSFKIKYNLLSSTTVQQVTNFGSKQTGAPPYLDTLLLPDTNKLVSDAGFRCGLCLALRSRRAMLGLVILFANEDDAFNDEDRDFLCCLADQIALAVENDRLLGQARQDADTKANLLHEVSHRVKNNLASILGIIALEIARAKSSHEVTVATMEDIETRIQGLATVHDLLSETEWSPLPIDRLISEVAHGALSGCPVDVQLNVSVIPSDETMLIGAQQAAGVALVVNELVTNSVKHAFHGSEQEKIDITLSSVPDQGIEVRYRDHGPGWPEDVMLGENESVGMRLVRITTRSPLRGTLELMNEDGAVAVLRFKPVVTRIINEDQ